MNANAYLSRSVYRFKGGKIHVRRDRSSAFQPPERITLCGLPIDSFARFVGTVSGQILPRPNVCKHCHKLSAK